MNSAQRHAYLKAMGITAWVPRDADKDSTGSVAAPEAATPPIVSQLSLPIYLNLLAETACEPVQTSGGDLLLVIEPPSLNTHDMELLGKMLGAIQLELASQSIVTLSADGSVSVRELLLHCQPKMVLVMAGCGGNAAIIDSHRQRHHKPEWCQASLAITHHPAELISLPELKRPAWEDLKRVKAALDG